VVIIISQPKVLENAIVIEHSLSIFSERLLYARGSVEEFTSVIAESACLETFIQGEWDNLKMFQVQIFRNGGNKLESVIFLMERHSRSPFSEELKPQWCSRTSGIGITKNSPL
jgi:hypothetical protein